MAIWDALFGVIPSVLINGNVGPVANPEEYAKAIGFQREAQNSQAQKDLGTEFYESFKDWKIAEPVQVEKGKPSIVALQNPTTGEIKKFELTGDLNFRSLNPGNVGTTLDTITTGPVGKTLDELFNWAASKTVLSQTKRPVRIKQNPSDEGLSTVANSSKQYLDKNLLEFVQTYLPQWVEKKDGTLIEENTEAAQKGYYNKLRSNIKMKFNVDLPEWKNADQSAVKLRDLLEQDGKIDPSRVRQFEKFLMNAEGGGLKKVKEFLQPTQTGLP